MSFATPYSRPIIPRLPVVEPIPVSTNNYLPYQVFVLQSRFQNIVSKDNVKYIVTPVSLARGDNMVLHLRIMLNNQEATLDEATTARYTEALTTIFEDHPNHCLFFTDTGVNLPNNWVQSFLPYLTLPSSYRPWCHDGKIYLDLHEVEPDFREVYNELFNEVISWLESRYREGAIVATEDFAERWGLQSMGAYYVPIWQQEQLAVDRVKFLLQRQQEEAATTTTLSLKVGRDQRVWDVIARLYPDVKFTGDYALLPAVIDNIETALSVTAQIFYEINSQPLPRVDISCLAYNNLREPSSSSNTVVYEVLDRERPYIRSTRVQ